MGREDNRDGAGEAVGEQHMNTHPPSQFFCRVGNSTWASHIQVEVGQKSDWVACWLAGSLWTKPSGWSSTVFLNIWLGESSWTHGNPSFICVACLFVFIIIMGCGSHFTIRLQPYMVGCGIWIWETSFISWIVLITEKNPVLNYNQTIQEITICFTFYLY